MANFEESPKLILVEGYCEYCTDGTKKFVYKDSADLINSGGLCGEHMKELENYSQR